jgi:hypothetical protein
LLSLETARKLSDVRAAAQKRRLALEGLQWSDEQEAQKTKRPSGRPASPSG